MWPPASRWPLAAALVAAAAAGCGTQAHVTGKHRCTKHGKPAYCLTVTGGHVVYVPASTYRAARAGDSFDAADDSVHAPAPAGDHGGGVGDGGGDAGGGGE